METSTELASTPTFAVDLNPLPVGTRLQEFVIECLIGVGGFGIVYQAHDSSLNRKVAIKEYMPTTMAARLDGVTVGVLSQAKSFDFEAGKTSFLNEARMLAQFRHPALIEVLRFWEQNSTAYMAMPFYQGSTLKDYLRAQGGNDLTEAHLRGLLVPVLEALQHMHASNVYHRDISPDNIMVLDDGRSMLLDLGAARRLEAQSNQHVTMLVKPGYAPIEQYAADSGIEQGPWTDIYGWGATAYYALTGKPPPPSASRIMSDSIKQLSVLRPQGYSRSFLQALDAALAVRPDDRPQNVAALKDLLGVTETSEPIVAPESAPSLAVEPDITPSLVEVSLAKQPRKKPLALWGGLLALVAALFGGVLLFKPSAPEVKAVHVGPEPVAKEPLPVSAVPIVPVVPAPLVKDEAKPLDVKPVELKPVEAKPSIAKLAIQPWGEVFVNGESRGVSPPLKILNLPEGEYRIEIRNGDYPAFVSNRAVKTGQVFTLSHTFSDSPPASK